MASIHEIAAAFSLPVTAGSTMKFVVGPDVGDYGTIQDAVDAAMPGDTIFVHPGSYDENVVVSRDYITLVGTQKGRYGWPDIVPTTGVALTVTGQGFVARNLRIVGGDTDAIVQRGNGARYERCVIDSGTGLAATEGLLRLQGLSTDDAKTASECRFIDCLFRGASGLGVIFQGAEPPDNGVGSSDNEFIDCTFRSSLDGAVAEDMVTKDSVGGSTYSVKNLVVKRCVFADKNKATYIDFTTENGGAAGDQSGVFADCYFNDDTLDTTAIKATGTAFGFVGTHSADGEVDGSGLD